MRDAQLSPLLLLHPDDNVFVARRSVEPQEVISIDGSDFRVRTSVPLGHKVARIALPPGTPVLKYGAPIGSTIRHVDAGEHVHLHNMKSDYLPSHTREVGPRDGSI
jgi:(2R)-sulfolactate sulfo-lyase subunit alpha